MPPTIKLATERFQKRRNKMLTQEINETSVVHLTTHQLLELSEGFNNMRSQVSGVELRAHLFRLSARLFAYADRRRRANAAQAKTFEISLRRVRSVKSTGEIR